MPRFRLPMSPITCAMAAVADTPKVSPFCTLLARTAHSHARNTHSGRSKARPLLSHRGGTAPTRHGRALPRPGHGTSTRTQGTALRTASHLRTPCATVRAVGASLTPPGTRAPRSPRTRAAETRAPSGRGAPLGNPKPSPTPSLNPRTCHAHAASKEGSAGRAGTNAAAPPERCAPLGVVGKKEQGRRGEENFLGAPGAP